MLGVSKKEYRFIEIENTMHARPVLYNGGWYGRNVHFKVAEGYGCGFVAQFNNYSMVGLWYIRIKTLPGS